MNAVSLETESYFFRKMPGWGYMVLEVNGGIGSYRALNYERNREHQGSAHHPTGVFTSMLGLWPKAVKVFKEMQVLLRAQMFEDSPGRQKLCERDSPTVHLYMLEYQGCRRLTRSHGSNRRWGRGWRVRITGPVCRGCLFKWPPLGDKHCRPLI